MVPKKTFLIIPVILIFVSCFIKSNDSEVSETFNEKNRTEKLEYMLGLENLADTIDKYIDTSFYAAYRAKPNEFFFNYIIKVNEIGNPFVISDSLQKIVLNKARNFEIRRILRFPNENFFRYRVYNDASNFTTFFVLDSAIEKMESQEFEEINDIDSFYVGKKIKINQYIT